MSNRAVPPAALSPQQRDAGLFRFPILVLEERRLSPALGCVFDAKWLERHESIVSTLWKFGKANALPGHLVASQLRANIEPYDGVEAPATDIDLRRLRHILAIPLKTLRSALVVASLLPMSCAVLRYCPSCMSRGYHCVVQQVQSLQNCPIHKTPLLIACRSCGYEAPYRLSALLLNAPYRCAQCRRRYGNSDFRIKDRRPLDKKAQVLMGRLHFRHLCF